MSTKSFAREQKTDFYSEDLGPILSKIYAARGISDNSDLSKSLKDLISYKELTGVVEASACIVEAINAGKNIVIIGDFDTDGATSTALLLRFFKQIEYSNVNFIIPSRFGSGYGLSKELIDTALSEYDANLLITVDNGITAVDEVQYANERGLQVVITDHHQPGEEALPSAVAIVNPNQPGCNFPSKNLAGVGVAFYLLIALRESLRQNDYFARHEMPDPNLAEYLDLVALGTLADMVTLDKNNRIMVHQGLLRIKSGACSKGISALLAVGQKNQMQVSGSDLTFAVAPRLNAAGRVSNMSIGVECLISDSFIAADKLAEQLDDLNQERRSIESEMQKSALEVLEGIELADNLPLGICMFGKDWHQGVSGILASRLKDLHKRPVVVFARHIADGEEYAGELKGSARSIKHVDVRGILAKIDADHPEIINKFGGHKAAAGLSISEINFESFKQLFEEYVAREITEDDCYEEFLTDGTLPCDHYSIDFASLIRDSGPWGMNFPEPIFEGRFKIMEQRIVGQRHLKLSLHPDGGYEVISSICFNVDLNEWIDYSCSEVDLVFRLDVSEYKGSSILQLIIVNIEKVFSEQAVGIVEF